MILWMDSSLTGFLICCHPFEHLSNINNQLSDVFAAVIIHLNCFCFSSGVQYHIGVRLFWICAM